MCKSTCQQLTRRAFVETASSQVEQGIRIKLTAGCAVAALDIIGVYFEFRFGIDFRFIRQQQIVIGLIRIGSVGAGVYYGFSIPYAACCASEDATIFLM